MIPEYIDFEYLTKEELIKLDNAIICSGDAERLKENSLVTEFFFKEDGKNALRVGIEGYDYYLDFIIDNRAYSSLTLEEIENLDNEKLSPNLALDLRCNGENVIRVDGDHDGNGRFAWHFTYTDLERCDDECDPDVYPEEHIFCITIY